MKVCGWKKVWSVYTSSGKLLVVGSRGRRVVSESGPRVRSVYGAHADAAPSGPNRSGLGRASGLAAVAYIKNNQKKKK